MAGDNKKRHRVTAEENAEIIFSSLKSDTSYDWWCIGANNNPSYRNA